MYVNILSNKQRMYSYHFIPLISKVMEVIKSKNIYSSPFIIDMEHELAMFIYNEVKSKVTENMNADEVPTDAKISNSVQKVLMHKANYICSQPNENILGSAVEEKCAMYAGPMDTSHCVSKSNEFTFLYPFFKTFVITNSEYKFYI